MRKFLFSFLGLCLFTCAFAAAGTEDFSVSASVNKTTLTVDDELILTVMVDGVIGNFNPQLPSLPAFNVYGGPVSQTIQNFHASTAFQYIMIPRFPGQTVIGPISINYKGKTYQTDPISVTVYRTGTAAADSQAAAANQAASKTANQASPAIEKAPANMPALEKNLYNRALNQRNQDFFLIMSASQPSPYVNQTFTVAVRFYYARPFLEKASYAPPTVDNLFLEEIGRSEGHQEMGGKSYNYFEIRYAASGVTAGKAKIEPASINFIPASHRNISIWDQMFAAIGQDPQSHTSNSLSFNIQAVPSQDRPKSFYGAVGNGYALSAEVDRTQVEAGEAINLTVKVTGPGNLKTTSDLVLPNLPGFKTYDVAATVGAIPTNGSLKSYKIFKTIIVPLSSGQYTIPAIAWSYFDPASKEFRTLRTQPIDLSVAPSSKTNSGFDFRSQTDLSNGFQELSQDIHYLKTNENTPQANVLLTLSNYSFINYIVLGLLLASLVFALLGKRTLASKHAILKVRHQLKTATNAETVANALSAYLQQAYGIHTASQPLRSIEAALTKKGCPRPVIKQFSMLWQQLDTARFAPSALQGQSQEELAKQALACIAAIDKGVQK